jgi:hypothetical protein
MACSDSKLWGQFTQLSGARVNCPPERDGLVAIFSATILATVLAMIPAMIPATIMTPVMAAIDLITLAINALLDAVTAIFCTIPGTVGLVGKYGSAKYQQNASNDNCFSDIHVISPLCPCVLHC